VTISSVLGDAFSVYQRLWRRSVVVAGLVFAVVSLATAFAGRHPTVTAELVAVTLSLIGSLLVQGALVEVVRDLHEGHAPATATDYYNRTRGALGTLLGATILAGIGVGVGFVLLVVPGLILLSRWSLIVPLVMVERRGIREAFSRSNSLVKGKTGRVLVVVLVAGLITGIAASLVSAAFTFLSPFWAAWIGGTVAGALTAPYEAHVFTVLYYKLTEPERPVLPPEPPRETWRSVWDEEPPA
jgi:hypothetical protein